MTGRAPVRAPVAAPAAVTAPGPAVVGEPPTGTGSPADTVSPGEPRPGRPAGDTETLARIAAEAARGASGVHAVVSTARGTAEVERAADRGSATVRLRLVTDYGRNVGSVCEAVRHAVSDRIGTLTGVRVLAVDITVDDLFVAGDSGAGDGGAGERDAVVECAG